MTKNCNLCGLRNDTTELVQKKRTWCLVHDKEVDNKNSGCEYWRPDDNAIKTNKVQIANEIKDKTFQEKREQFEFEKHGEIIEQQILNRRSAEDIAKCSSWIAIIAAIISLAGAIAAWIAVSK